MNPNHLRRFLALAAIAFGLHSPHSGASQTEASERFRRDTRGALPGPSPHPSVGLATAELGTRQTLPGLPCRSKA